MAVAGIATRAPILSEKTANTIHPVARLAQLHAEAAQTVRLGELLNRAPHVATALVLMSVAALASGGASIAESLTWAMFVFVVAAAIVVTYRRAISFPFELRALKSLSQDFRALVVIAGFVWGAGAYFTLSSITATVAIVFFSAGACAIISVLLRESRMTFLFLAPVATLSSLACLIRPADDGLLDAAAILVTCALIMTATMILTRASARDTEMPELVGLPAA